MIQVIVVEDQRIHREYMENLLLHSGRYALLQSVTASDIAVQLLRTASAELILMDIVVNGSLDGVEAAAQIKQFRPDIKIIIVTSMLDADCLARAKEVGADSMWYKDASEESLMDVIDRTMAGEHIFPDSSPAVNVGYVRSDEFTTAENDILRELVNGLSSKQISDKLNLSARTVDWHVKNLLGKTGLPNRTALAIQAARGNLFLIKKEADTETK